jgi:hypothetical protein
MAITSRILTTVYNPIPTWKGTEILPEILTISADAPPISGSVEEIIDFHCAETFDKNANIVNMSEPEVIKYELVTGTKYDDQS